MLHRLASSLLAGLLLVGLFALPVRAQTPPTPEQQIRQMLEQRDREIKRLVADGGSLTAAQRDQLADFINGVIDFEAMGRAAVGPFWNKMTPAQQTEYIDLFSTIVREQSLSDLDVYNSKVTYDTITVDGDSAHVKTVTVYKDRPINVDYVLLRKDKEWYALDIVIDEASTLEAYQRSFQGVARKKGVDALLNSLRKKRDKIVSS